MHWGGDSHQFVKSKSNPAAEYRGLFAERR